MGTTQKRIEPVGYCREIRLNIWQRLGFGECAAPRPEDEDNVEGYAQSWLIVGTKVYLGFADRLRVLLSGSIMVDQAVKTDATITRSYSRSAVSVLPPRSIRRELLLPNGSLHKNQEALRGK